ncbi:MAG: glutamyl-tRNA reductase [Acidimicrobiia bacterium]|nr:glutamyl-tRNA reductase [Acidimicrobiia bacterium]
MDRLVCLGLSHRTAPVELRSRFGSLGLGATRCPAVAEHAVLSTCYRVELYAYLVDGVDDARHELITALAESHGTERQLLVDHLYVHTGGDVTRHLARVASGLDSLVLGESEVLGQVGDALTAAAAAGTVGAVLSLVFRTAIGAGRRARTESAIGSNPATASSMALALADSVLGHLDGKRALVVGAGRIGVQTLEAITRRGISEVALVNRSRERAVATAPRFQAAAFGLDELVDALAWADLAVTATASQTPVVSTAAVEEAMARRPDRPLVVIDVAVPADVERGVGLVPGARLFDVDDLRIGVSEAMTARFAEVPRVEAIVGEEVEAFTRRYHQLEVEPLVAAIRQRAEETRRHELDRTLRHLGDVDPDIARRIGQLSRSLVNKVLHEPTVQLRLRAGNGQPDAITTAARQLFGIGDVATQPRAVVVGTRGSALARAQAERVCRLLAAAWPGLKWEVRPMVTRGDRTQASGEPLSEIGGKGLFTAEFEEALRAGTIDVAVHSLKDLPTVDAPGTVLGAVCLRQDVGDCLVSRDGLTLDTLPAGAVVGTSSLRRTAQLRAVRPDLVVRSIRGNVDTRIAKVRQGHYDAVVLAAAGIMRLGLEGQVSEWLALDTVLPAPGQGALGVQCRQGDDAMLHLLAAIDDPAARATTSAERGFLDALGAGCTAPVAALAEVVDDDRVRLRALVSSLDGDDVVRVSGDGVAHELGRRLAAEALAAGADRILEAARVPPGLAGRRVVVTRPPGQADGLAIALVEHGATLVSLPLIRIEPAPDAALADVEDLDAYDWVVFTSANGVGAIPQRLRGTVASARIAAVGPATAAAVRGLGAEPSLVPERFAADELVAGLEPLRGARLLLLQADIADPRFADELRNRGAHVEAVTAYRTVTVEPSSAELEQLGDGVDAIVLASGSAARSLARLVSRHPELGRLLLACIGPTTAAAAAEAGLTVGVVADEATADGIVVALTSHFGGAHD